MSENLAPIIIIKKKSGHGGHHGGAWKVAYADFVTAMMALFIVLWLLSSSEQVKKAVSAYFLDPSGTGAHSGSASTGTGESVSIGMNDMEKLKEKLEQALKKSPEFEKLKDYLKMSVTGEGLRVEMMESEKGIFFDSGSGRPSEVGHELIVRLGEELKKLPNDLMIEGYTDAKPFSSGGEYSNWELSTDRANAARKLMEENGLPHGRIVEVRGFADQNLRDKEHPEAACNRRISVIVRYKDVPDAEPVAKPGEKSDEKSTEKHAEKPPAAEHH
jgi:chemotaxis protein MotB